MRWHKFLLEIDFSLIRNAFIVHETFLLLSRNISVYFKDMIFESSMYSFHIRILLIDKPYGSLQVRNRINKPNPFWARDVTKLVIMVLKIDQISSSVS